VATPSSKRATYADLDAFPEGTNVELVRGELITSPRPSSRQASAASNLGAILVSRFRFGEQGPGGWIILFEPELRISDDCLIPDLAGWRRERLPELPEVATFDLAPDWVCEVLSPSTAAHDRGVKLPLYARWGVQHAWLVDPTVKTVEIFRLEGGSWRVVGTLAGDGKVRAEPFEAVELDLSLLWAR
jgi:Uma2 family endonuclease